MKAQIKPGYNASRVELWKVIPLKTPYTVYISASHLCNLRCSYCSYSEGHEQLAKNGHEFINTDIGLVKRLIAQLKERVEATGEKVKLVLFTGLGEPLMNPELPSIIRLIKDANITDNIEMYTNGILLTPEKSDALIEAGLTKLRISIQGLNDEQYLKVTNKAVVFDQLIEQIGYFYKHKAQCTVYVKIIDALIDVADESKFYETFANISDQMFIEHLVTAQNSMGDYGGQVDDSITMYKEVAIKKEVCPLPFYVIQMDSQGYIFPCTPLGLPKTFAVGNIKEETLEAIWQGEKLRQIRQSHLEKKRMTLSVCATCDSFNCITHATDNLDNHCHELLKRI